MSLFGAKSQHIGLLALVFSIFFIASLAGLLVLPFIVLFTGVAAPFITQRFDWKRQMWWVLPASLSTTLLIALGILASIRTISILFWCMAILLFATTSITSLCIKITQRRCKLCNRRLGSYAVTFNCPRCGLAVCDEHCWKFEQRRCRMCEENHVPALPAQNQWWDRQLGPRILNGRCQICMASPEQADLRICGHCRRPQCRDCWDQSNGECSRCSWIMPGLPQPLKVIAANLTVRLEQ
jgi:hypothetical protein